MDSTSILDVVLRIFQGLLTPVIAFIAVYIAYQQHKTNRDKLRLDLYNKRYKVFYGLMALLGHISQQAKVKIEQVDEFSRATKEAVFLFDEGISTYLETIRKKALDLWATEEEMNPLPVGEQRSAKAVEVRNLCHWFTKQSEVAIDKFNKYLKFEQKLKVKAMNWKRGFRRMTLVLAIIVAGFGGLLGFIVGYDIYDYPRYRFRVAEYNYKSKYLISARKEAYDELRRRGKTIEEIYPQGGESLPIDERKAIAELIELEKKNTFRIFEFIRLPILGSFGGIAISFCSVWLLYYIIEWVFLGFCEKRKDERKQ